jgi:hypothetical protein
MFMGATNEPWNIDYAMLRPAASTRRSTSGLPRPRRAEEAPRAQPEGDPACEESSRTSSRSGGTDTAARTCLLLPLRCSAEFLESVELAHERTNRRGPTSCAGSRTLRPSVSPRTSSASRSSSGDEKGSARPAVLGAARSPPRAQTSRGRLLRVRTLTPPRRQQRRADDFASTDLPRLGSPTPAPAAASASIPSRSSRTGGDVDPRPRRLVQALLGGRRGLLLLGPDPHARGLGEQPHRGDPRGPGRIRLRAGPPPTARRRPTTAARSRARSRCRTSSSRPAIRSTRPITRATAR